MGGGGGLIVLGLGFWFRKDIWASLKTFIWTIVRGQLKGFIWIIRDTILSENENLSQIANL